jgi:hypothetical protein
VSGCHHVTAGSHSSAARQRSAKTDGASIPSAEWLDRYTHLTDERVREAAKRFDPARKREQGVSSGPATQYGKRYGKSRLCGALLVAKERAE